MLRLLYQLSFMNLIETKVIKGGRFKFNNHVFVICELLTTAMTG